jgi:hypothetical protein
MGYPEEIRKQMRALTPDKKWTLVCQEQHRDKMKVQKIDLDLHHLLR